MGRKPGIQFLVSKQELHRIFLFSQMTIINEMLSYENYFTLKFIEFLEMLCRGAIKAAETGQLHTSSHKPVDRVEAFLNKILERMQKNKVTQFRDMKVKKIIREMRQDLDIHEHIADLCDHSHSDDDSHSHSSLQTESEIEEDHSHRSHEKDEQSEI